MSSKQGGKAKLLKQPKKDTKDYEEVQGMYSDAATLRKAYIWREASRVIHEEGIRAFWKGNLITIAHRLPYSSISFYSYEKYNNILQSFPRLESNRENISAHLFVRLTSGFLAGVTSAAATYPLDLVRTRLSAQTNVMYYKGMWHALRTISTDEGIFCLYKGLGATLLLMRPWRSTDFVVSLSMEVNSGVLEAILPVELVKTTELKLRNSYQWQPLETFVTISRHFLVKASGIRFHGPIDDCNIILQQLKYYGTEYGAVLKITINDMGNYGCSTDFVENVSKPLLAEANVNLIKRMPFTSRAAHVLGFIAILEFIAVVSLGVVLLFYTCKCAISLMNQHRMLIQMLNFTLLIINTFTMKWQRTLPTQQRAVQIQSC